jgi:hypothetical protein
MDKCDRVDAMWLVSVSDGQIPPTLSHPSRIRRWFNENQQTSSLPEDLQTLQVEQEETLRLDQRTGESIL